MTDPAPDHVGGKIADARLRQMARNGAGSATVIVELDVPQPRVEIEREPLGGSSSWRATRVRAPSHSEQRHIDDLTLRARSFLEELAESPPVPLAADGAFAVHVSGKSLQTIARSPLVRRIYPSELRR